MTSCKTEVVFFKRKLDDMNTLSMVEIYVFMKSAFNMGFSLELQTEDYIVLCKRQADLEYLQNHPIILDDILTNNKDNISDIEVVDFYDD
jgi:hypothetical protein